MPAHASDAATPGVIVRPPLLFLVALLLGLAADRLLPLPFPLADPVRWIAAGAAFVAGVAVFAAGVRNFSAAGTPVRGHQPTRALVTTGIHAWSRNPIYVGMFLLYLGIGLVARGPWILVLVLPLAITIRYVVVAREEAYLERRYGDAYRDYKARVRCWL
jgi:protein-S-isoprenylcysteine O-methyltransferase Ste14